MEYGLGAGLAAINIDYNSRINQLHQNEQLDLRARNEAEQRARLYAQDAEFANAANSHDAPIIKEFSRGIIKKMGEYRRNNPDLMYNPDKLIQFNLLKRELKDNTDLSRGMASDASYKEYVKDLQEVSKNPQMHDTQAYKDIEGQWNNYLQFGNQSGQGAALKEGKKAFLYTKPQEFVADLPGTLLKIGDNIKDYNVVKGKNPGEWWTEAKPEHLLAAKQSAYSQYGRQIQVTAQKLGLKTPGEIDTWVTNNIAGGIKKNYQIGDVNADFEKWYKMQQLGLEKEKIDAKKPGSGYSTWDYFISPQNKAGRIDEETIRKTWGDKPEMIIIGNSGAKVDLTGNEWYSNQKYVKRHGIPFLLGYTKIPIKTAADKGIISEYDPDDEKSELKKTTARITSDYLGLAAYATDVDKNGNPYNYIKVSYNLPVNPNDAMAKQKFNVFNDVDKLVPAARDPYAPNKIYEGSAGDFKAAGYTDAQIQEGVSRGLIKLR